MCKKMKKYEKNQNFKTKFQIPDHLNCRKNINFGMIFYIPEKTNFEYCESILSLLMI